LFRRTPHGKALRMPSSVELWWRTMSFDTKLKELGIALPQAPKPVANYVPVVRVGDLLFLSGILPSRGGQLIMTGKFGADLSVEQGIEAAKTAALNALAIVQSEVGSLDRVKRIVKMVGHIASAQASPTSRRS
jgi:enamine deaminase RidA (YjgF/YER057c/UK114 family)